MGPRRRTPRLARLSVGLTGLVLGGLAAVALASPGQPGALDTTFANHGVASFGSGPAAGISFIAAETIQPDGKVVMVGPTKPDQSGATRMGVVRLNSNGSLDTTFGAGTGAVLIGFGSGNSATATAVALQRNGDIVVVGAAHVGTDRIGVTRLTPSGLLDSSFNSTGATPGETTVDTADTAQTPPDTVGVAVQPADQKIVVVGTQSLLSGSAFQVSRLTASGSLDTANFGSGTGTVTTQVGSSSSESSAAVVAVQADGRIVVAGNGTTNTGSRDFQVARYLGNGTLDGSFNRSGSQPGTEDIPLRGEDPNAGAAVQAIAIQPADQKLVLAGGPRGGPQTGFGSVENGHAALVRLNANGTPDSTFSGGGQTGGEDLVPFPNSNADTANALTIDPATGKLLVAGTAELAVQGHITGEIIADRLNPDGSLDAAFGDPGTTALGPGGSAAVDLLNTVSNAVDALIGGTVGNSAGAIAITATAPPSTTTSTPTTTIPPQCGQPTIGKKAHDAVRGDVRAVGRGLVFAYVVTVANRGPCALANVVISDSLARTFDWFGPASGSVVFASPVIASPQSLITSSNSHQAVVSAATLPAGDSVTVSLPGRATALGRQSDTATVTATALPALRSNSVTLDVTTTPRAGATRVNARAATGTASAGSGGPEAALSQIAHVDIAVRSLTARTHAASRGCLWLGRRGRLVRLRPGKSGKCDSPLWLRAIGKRRWTYRFGRPLSSGRYQLLVRASNRAGVYDTTFAPSHHDLVTFGI